MRGKRTYFGAILAIILAQPATAGEATEEGAKELLQTFEMYLGKAAGDSGSLTVKPDGDAYLVSFDIGNAMKPLEQAGVKVEPAVASFHVTDEDGGKYNVSDLKLPALVLAVKDMKIAYAFEGVNFTGTFDSKIAGFSESHIKLDKVAYQQSGGDAAVQVVESAIEGQQTSTPAATGVANLKQHLTIGGLTEQIGKPGGGPNINVSFGSIVADVGIAALKSQAIWDVWGFLIENGSAEKITAATPQLKTLLGNLLPIFDKLDEDVKFSDMGVDTPMGRVTFGSLGFKVATTGAVEQGNYVIALSGAKPGIPAGLVPPWAVKLVPTDFLIGANLSGLNLNAAARQLIADFDPSQKEPVSKESLAKAGSAMWAAGPIKVTFAPSHITAATYEISMSGDATIGIAGPPTVHALVTAKGVDETMAALDAAKQSDPTAGQAVLMLATAKGLGKAGADGTTTWEIQVGADGVPTVNGTKLGK